MKYILIFIFIFLLLPPAFAESPKSSTSKEREQRREKLWKMVHREMEMIKQQSPLGPRLTNRLLELKTEKLALLKEKENQNFLHAMEKGRVNRGEKEKFFKKSNQLLKDIRRQGLKTIKKYPNYRGVPEIYQTLALNERDYNDSKYLKKFAKRSLQHPHFPESLAHRSRVLLAEYLYNEKQYTAAINYYKKIVQNNSDQWLSKHLFNLGWCQYKKQRKNKAIEILHKALNTGKRKSIIPIEKQIQQSLALFYIQTKRVPEAIEHFKKTEKNAVKHMAKLLKLAMEQGSYSQALKSYASLKTLAKKREEVKAYHKALNKGLELYRGDKKYAQFIRESKRISKDFKTGRYKGHNNVLKQSIKKMSSMAGYFQEMLKKNDGKKKQQTNRAFTLFGLLENIDKENAHKYRFFIGETHFIGGDWHSATKSYLQAYKMMKKQKGEHSKTRKKYLDAALGTLARAEEEGSKREKSNGYPMTKYTYYQYIKLFPKSDTAKQIYPRLFNLEFNAENDKKAEKVISYYAQKVPKDKKIQKDLATKIMDHHIEKREARKLNDWIGKLKNGFLKFSTKEINKTVEILGQLVFSNIEKFENNADTKKAKKKAYKTYKKLYQKKRYPRRIKAKTAYNLFRLSILTFRYDRAKEWYQKMKKHFTKREYREYFSRLNSLAHETFLQQNRLFAIKLTKNFFYLYCRNKSYRPKKFNSQIKTTHERFLTYTLAIHNSDKYLDSLNTINKCPIKDNIIYGGIKRVALTSLYQKKHRRFLKLAGYLEKKPNFTPHLVSHYKNLYWFYYERDKAGIAARIFNRLDKITKDSQIQDIRLYRNYLKKAQKRTDELKPNFPKTFAEKEFQAEIERVVSGLEKFQTATRKVLETKNPHMVIRPLLLLTRTYENLAESLREYRPNGLPKEIRESFTKQMTAMADQFEQQSKDHLGELKNSMEEQEIYTLSNQKPYRRHTKRKQFFFSAKIYSSTYDIPRTLKRKKGKRSNKTARATLGSGP